MLIASRRACIRQVELIFTSGGAGLHSLQTATTRFGTDGRGRRRGHPTLSCSYCPQRSSWKKFTSAGHADELRLHGGFVCVEQRCSIEFFPYDRRLRLVAKLCNPERTSTIVDSNRKRPSGEVGKVEFGELGLQA